MNTNKFYFLALFFLVGICGLQARSYFSVVSDNLPLASPCMSPYLPTQDYVAKLYISHGHCAMPVQGYFSSVSVNYESPGLKDLKIDFEISTNSLVANDEPESSSTKAIKSEDAFDAVHYPGISFVCKDNIKTGKDENKLIGLMTIKGKTLPGSFVVTPVYQNGCGNPRITQFVLDGSVELGDFGIKGDLVGPNDNGSRTMIMNILIKSNDC